MANTATTRTHPVGEKEANPSDSVSVETVHSELTTEDLLDYHERHAGHLVTDPE